ncbi:MAG TPA: hypothetical protein VLD86_02935 [Ilumatobacteraceae bacterium]|nr:hypothetical protein [Ilumatobacteraceae bacterium]
MVAGVTLTGVSVSAATLSNLSGQSCGDLIGTWHFVNNQVPAGSPLGTLTATFSSGEVASDIGEAKGGGSTQHFYVTASGTLTGASTDLGGKLVLSDFSCNGGKKGGGGGGKK